MIIYERSATNQNSYQGNQGTHTLLLLHWKGVLSKSSSVPDDGCSSFSDPSLSSSCTDPLSSLLFLFLAAYFAIALVVSARLWSVSSAGSSAVQSNITKYE